VPSYELLLEMIALVRGYTEQLVVWDICGAFVLWNAYGINALKVNISNLKCVNICKCWVIV